MAVDRLSRIGTAWDFEVQDWVQYRTGVLEARAAFLEWKYGVPTDSEWAEAVGLQLLSEGLRLHEKCWGKIDSALHEAEA